MRVRLAVGDDFTAFHGLALEDVELAPLRDQLLVLLGVVAGDDQAALALGLLAEADRAGLLREDRRVLGLARLEQVRHARQTAGDVAGLGGLLRDAGDDIAHRHARAVLEADTSAPGGSVYTAGISVFAKVISLPLAFTSFMVARTSLPPRCLVSSTTVEDRPVTSSTCVVTVRPSTKSWNLRKPADLGDDRVGVRIPGRHDLAALDRGAFLGADDRAVGDLVALALAAEVVDHADLARARHRHQVALLVLHGLDVVEAHDALVAHLDAARPRRLARRHHRCGRYAWSAACRARRSTARR